MGVHLGVDAGDVEKTQDFVTHGGRPEALGQALVILWWLWHSIGSHAAPILAMCWCPLTLRRAFRGCFGLILTLESVLKVLIFFQTPSAPCKGGFGSSFGVCSMYIRALPLLEVHLESNSIFMALSWHTRIEPQPHNTLGLMDLCLLLWLSPIKWFL